MILFKISTLSRKSEVSRSISNLNPKLQDLELKIQKTKKIMKKKSDTDTKLTALEN